MSSMLYWSTPAPRDQGTITPISVLLMTVSGTNSTTEMYL